MPNTVDSRVVKMTFDNSSFQKNTQQSMDTINRLNGSIDSLGASNGLQRLSESANNVNLSGVESGVESLKSRFSSLGIVGMTVIQNLTNSILNMGTKALGGAISSVTQGGLTRAENIEQAKFQLEGLHVSWKKIEPDILYGVKDTAYGLDSAAKAASQLSASGIKTGKDMKSSLRGISGLAAMTGSSYDDIASVFTTVAGNGRLMSEQLLQISSRGINAAATLAKHLHTSEKNVRDMVSKGKIDFKTFSDAMDEAYGKHAKKANELFSGALANTKAALARIGADVQTPKLEAMRDILNASIPVIDNLHKALRPLLKDMGENQKKISSNIVKALKNIDTKQMAKDVENISDLFKGLTSILGFLWKAISPFFAGTNSIVHGLATMSGALGRFISGVTDATARAKAFTSATKTIASVSKALGKGLESIANTISSGLGKVFTSLSNAITNLVKQIGRLSSDSDKAFSVFNASGMVMIIAYLTRMVQGLSSPSKIFETFIRSLSATSRSYYYSIKRIPMIMNDLYRSMLIWQANVNSNIILKIAVAIGILAGAVAILSSIDTGKLVAATGAIAALGVILAVTFKLMTGFSKTDGAPIKKFKGILADIAVFANTTVGLISLGVALISISTALLIMSSAVKKLSSLSWGDLAKGLGSIVVLLIALVKSSMVLGKNAPMTMKGSAALVIFAGALYVMASAIKKLGGLSWLELGKGLGTVIALLVALTIASKPLGKNAPMTIRGAASLAIFAGALSLMGLALKQLGSLSWESLAKGLSAVVGLVLVLVGVSSELGGSSQMTMRGATSLVIFAGALNLIEIVIKKLSELSWEELAKGLVVVTGLMVVMAKTSLALGESSGMGIKGALAMGIFATSIAILAKAILMLAGLSVEQLLTGLDGLAGGLAILAIGLHAMKGTKDGTLELTMATFAIMAFVPALIKLGNMSIGNMVKSLIMLGSVMAIFGAAAMVLEPVIGIMLELALVFDLFAAGVVGVGIGLSLITTSIVALTSLAKGSLDSLKDTISVVAQSLPTVMKNLGQGFVDFLGVIAKNAPQVLSSVSTIFGTILAAIAINAPKIVDTLLAILQGFLTSLGNHMPQIMAAGVKILVGFVEGIAQGIPKIAKAGADVVIAFLEAIGAQLPRIINAGFKMVIALINGISDAIRNNAKPLRDAMINLAEAMVYAIEVFLGIHSPSTKFAGIGKNIVLGLVNGIASFAEHPVKTIEAIGKAILDAFKQTLVGKEITKIAKSFSDGFTEGLKKYEKNGFAAAERYGFKAADGLRKGIKQGSPSKVTRVSGEFFGQGFIDGIKVMGVKAYNAAYNMGHTSTDGLNKSLNKLSSIMPDDFTNNPTITPVIDLSSVESGMSDLNRMLSNGSASNIAANLNAVAGNGKIQNGNEAVIKSLDKLRSTISKADTGNTYSVNGITYDEGTAISEAIKEIVRATIVEKRS